MVTDLISVSRPLQWLAIIGMLSQPALAEGSDEGNLEQGLTAGPLAANTPATNNPTIWIQRPTGTIVVSRAGDELGAVRYANREEGAKIAVVKFSSSRKGPAQATSPVFGGRTVAPIENAALTSNFGVRRDPITGRAKWHSGVDLAAPSGTPIKASRDGVVNSAGWRGGYGIAVLLDHGDGVQTLYGHMSRMNVRSGERVEAGQIIGLVGSTGRSTGPHLHFEVRKNGSPVKPLTR